MEGDDVDGRQDELLDEIADLVATGTLPDRGDVVMRRIAQMTDEFLRTGTYTPADDPFRGDDHRVLEDSRAFYVMFWRMFDRTPAALLQDFAIKLRRILGAKVFKHLGRDVTMHHNVLFSSGANISLGDGVFVNRDVMLDDRAALTVGAHTMLAAGVVVETHGHVLDDFSQPLPYGGRTLEPVSIGRECLIGYNGVIMAGTTVGRRVIVASNSVVTKDVDDYHVVGGVPARTIKTIAPPS